MGIKVTLRSRQISKGRDSLFFDFYPAIELSYNGKKTRREFLGMYVMTDPKTPLDKQYKKETLKLAEQIRQKREAMLNKPEIYTDYEKEQLKIKEKGEFDFIEYYKNLIRKTKGTSTDNWISSMNYLVAYTKGKLKFSQLDEQFCNGFKDFLLSTKSKRSSKVKLAQNSAGSYFNKFKAALKLAYKEGYLQKDLNAKISPIKIADSRREFLTIDELNKLVSKECLDPLLKRAALFSALTGMRFSDISKLLWSEVQGNEESGYYLRFKQRKTHQEKTLPISDQAVEIMGPRGNGKGKVFDGLNYSAYHNKHLYQWIGSAGITRNITFHSFRHTFATLQLSAGTDLYTISKMLGHKELKTTQIYTKVMDKNKREAANKIKIKL